MPKPFSAMPGPKGLPIIGSLLDYSKRFGRHRFDKMHLAKRENYMRYGPIYRERLVRTFVQLFDPVDIEKVFRNEGKYPNRPPLPLPVVAHKRDGEPLGLGLVNGEQWHRDRRAVQRCMLHPSAATIYLARQNRVADELIKHINTRLRPKCPADTNKSGDQLNSTNNPTTNSACAGTGAKSKKSVQRTDDDQPPSTEVEDLLGILSKYTMEAFGSVCFGKRIGCLETDLSPDSDAYRIYKATNGMFQAVQETTLSFPWYAVFRTALYNQFIESSRVCHGIARSYIEEALSNTSASPTETMPSAAADCRRETNEPNFLRTLTTGEHAKQLSLKQIVELACELFTAGIDSTAYALSFCLYNLARNVDKQSILALELDKVLGPLSRDHFGQPRPVTEDSLSQLSYLKACVKESFRLNYPTEGGTVRILEQDLMLSDYNVPKGTIVMMNHQTICLDQKYFDHAEKFLPERWLKHGSNVLKPAPSFVLLPFGYGARMCIGRRFAEQEIYLAVAKIIHHFTLEYHQKEEVGMTNRVFTMPDRPMLINFTPRQPVST